MATWEDRSHHHHHQIRQLFQHGKHTMLSFTHTDDIFRVHNLIQLQSRQTGTPWPWPPLPRQLHPNLHSRTWDRSAQRPLRTDWMTPTGVSGTQGCRQWVSSRWAEEVKLALRSPSVTEQLYICSAGDRCKLQEEWKQKTACGTCHGTSLQDPSRQVCKKCILCAPSLCFAHQSATFVLC